MRFTTVTALFLALSSVSVSANPNRLASGSHVRHVNPHHRSVARMVRSVASTVASPVLEKRKSKTGKCTVSSSNTTATITSDDSGDDDGDDGDSDSGDDDGDDTDDATSTTTTASATATGNHHHSSGAATATTTDASATTSSATTTSAGATGTGSTSPASTSGVAVVNDATCGSNNPSAETTKSTGPNGEESWFNCGLTGSGWTPPVMKLEQMVYISLEDALAMDGSPYKPCESNLDKFNSYGAEYKLPPIMLAAFAMQESTCNNDVTNPAGTIGMFQLAPQNCPDGVDCSDINNNFKYACILIIQYLADANQNVLMMVGAYNGWYHGMTKSKAEEAPCDEQQNLDYVMQWANAWMMGLNGYSVGTIQNCSGNFGKRKRSLYVPRYARSIHAAKEIGWHF